MSRPTVHTVHLHAHWDGPSSDCCKFTCPACANQLMAKRPSLAEPGVVAHFFQPCVYCGVATSLTIQGYSPNPTGDAPAPVVPEELKRSAEAPAAERPPVRQRPPEREGRMRLDPATLKQWRRCGALESTYLGGLKAPAVLELYERINHAPPTTEESVGGGDDVQLYFLDELEEMEAWLKTRLDH